tara:strand:+ start:861 stop:1640 length:780 start_codon:yes stop_codon:yes gene_type:complete
MIKKKFRLIPRLDIKGEHLIKGINLEGLRKIGSPREFAKNYYNTGADEVLIMDCVASLYDRQNIYKIINEISKEIFIPITVGGGIRNLEHATNLFLNGADKIAVNTAVTKNPKLISDLALKFGSSNVVLSIEAKKKSNSWEAFANSGRDHTGLDIFEWAKKGIELGIGEILLTSIDHEGTRKGFDIQLIEKFSNFLNKNKISIPIIVSGGMGKLDDLNNIYKIKNIDSIAVADLLHYKRNSIEDIKNKANKIGFEIRKV